MISLTPDERAKFAAYLRQEAETDQGLAEQMAKAGMPEAVQKRMRTRAMAKKIVADDLEAWEEQSISAGADDD